MKVSIRIRIKASDGRRLMKRPVVNRNGSLKPLWAIVGGKEEHHPEGIYALRFGNQWEFVGQTLDAVLAAKRQKEEELSRPAVVPAINQSGPAILEAMETYLGEKSKTDLALGREALVPKTISGMRTIISAFQTVCAKEFMREVTGADLLKYFAVVRAQIAVPPNDPRYTEELRKKNVTTKNHFAALRAFFTYFRIDLVKMLEPQQVPRGRRRSKEKYTRDEMSRMWAVAKPEEKIRLQFFVASGFRKSEVAHLTWDDIDLWAGMAAVTFKKGFKPKSRRVRTVKLPDWLTDLLRQRRAKHLNDTLVFPSATGLPPRCNQLLYMLKAVAKRGGVTGRLELHKFRVTHASMIRDNGGSTEDIQHRLGHADISTTEGYLTEMEQDNERAADQVNSAFDKLA